MEKIQGRIVALFAVLSLLACAVILRVFTLSQGTAFARAARENGTDTLTVSTTRGTFYDCNMQPITGTETIYLSAVTPVPEAAAAILNAVDSSQKELVSERIRSGKPFLQEVSSKGLSAKGLQVFEVKRRYSKNQLCPHLIGYTDASGHGVSGLEKLYDTWLSEAEGSLKLSYTVSALGQPLAGESPEITDTRSNSVQGIRLTIDSRIQQIAETAAQNYLTQGAVVVMEVPSGKIRACVSVPGFSPVELEDALTDQMEPMVNRALCSYNVGSVFKPVTAAAALEVGISPGQTYECTGSVDVNGVVFHCNNLDGHGTLDMEQALAHSCNCYFIQLAQDIGAEALWNMADRMGFGRSLTLCDGMAADQGTLPALSSLTAPAALANLSFGQGELMASPVQMAAVFCAIAADGQMPQPTLVEGLIGTDGKAVSQQQPYQSATVMTPQDAATLRSLLDAPMEYGTAVPAAPDNVAAGGKTATAETGIIRDGKSINQTWFAGFFPYDSPRYAVVVFAEASPSGSKTSSPVFKEIAEQITKLQLSGELS